MTNTTNTERHRAALVVPQGWKLVPVESTPEMLDAVRNGPTHETWSDGYRAMLAAAPEAPAVLAVAESVDGITIDGYKGKEEILGYIAALHRVRFLNQWLADVYCNALRHDYVEQAKSDGKDERTASFDANNKIADLWRSRRDHFVHEWPERRAIEDAERFASLNDRVTQSLLASIQQVAFPAPEAPAVPMVPQGWQPIETAPKDGSYFLAGNQHGVWVCHHQPVAVSGYRFDDPWRSVMLNHWHITPKADQYRPATHWTPLAAAPSPQEPTP